MHGSVHGVGRGGGCAIGRLRMEGSRRPANACSECVALQPVALIARGMAMACATESA
ncbi:MAG: hypothetical protein AVDCRST_MAG71-2042 [uncultured Lysobacter sp.]|uniref:Uncharacterized protein n=1 Tax=uncultured Lysobacter sp. TaxID=271060 RepID=A0A6J4LM45_9GAMM|nr:MAG: hypothetical protein AVDCRST_MAG71-2042 [uncultured Lysobacter sp.]